MRTVLGLFFLLLAGSVSAQHTFTNPIKASGPDPWVLQHNGWYYYMNTTGQNLTLWKTHNMADLATAESKVVFTPPPGQAFSRELWAPEIHRLNNGQGVQHWYIYVAADSGHNVNHRIWVFENSDPDPMKGQWVLKGKLTDPGDHWAIDLSVKEFNGKLYGVWSGWEGRVNGQQNIYIARLKNPWTMAGKRVRISQPDQPWERHGDVPVDWQRNGEVPQVLVNEGPEFLQHQNRLFVVYSANACWLDYCMGLLTYKGKGSLLNAKNWTKHTQPVFTQAPENGVFAPGHGSFFRSSTGTDWMIYHANPSMTDGCGNKRAPHIQPFTWHPDGTPDFGKPLAKQPIPVPE